MKALIISEDKKLIDFYSSIFVNFNIDVIVYKWFLKALDNVEEIKPEIIVLNTEEYPRHWKILVQFLKSGIAGEKPCYILHSPKVFDEQENKKIDFLNIDCYVTSFDEFQTDKIKSLLSKITNKNEPEQIINDNVENDCFSVDMLLNNAPKKDSFSQGFYILTNPINQKFIYGKYLEYNGNKITCKIENDDDFLGIENNSIINYVSFYNNQECKTFSAKVNEYLELSNQKFIVLDVCDFYEEK